MQVVDFCHYPGWPAPGGREIPVNGREQCPYLAGREASFRNVWAEWMGAEEYGKWMNAGFRRAGRVVYQPVCVGCRECVPIRVTVAEFAASKSQRRAWRRNRDLRVEWRGIEDVRKGEREERYQLYRRYYGGWHGGEACEFEQFEWLYYESCVETVEFTYRTAAGELVALGWCDVGREYVSSVYFLFDPAEAGRSLGTFGALVEIEFARQIGAPYYYLGYWVRHCQEMTYKASYRPHEFLGLDGVWRRAAASPER